MSLLTFSPQSKARIRGAFLLMTLGSVSIAFSKTAWGGALFILFILSFALMGWKEFTSLLKQKNLPVFTNLGTIFITLFLFAFFIQTREEIGHPLSYWVALATAATLFLTAMKNPYNEAIVSISTSLLGMAYVALPLTALIGINYSPLGGRLWLFFLLAVVKLNDVGGYIVGKRYGKHALAPILSPKKTWEGAIGGFLLGIIVGFFFYLFGLGTEIALSFQEIFFLSLLLRIVAQFGDLAESCLKRDASIKDSNTLAGFGGVLDITDSLAFSAPLLYIYLT